MIWGVWGITALLNGLTHVGGDEMYAGSTAAFVRGWGFVFLLVPVAWVLGTVRAENRVEWFSKRWNAASGFLLILALVFFFMSVAGQMLGGIDSGMSSEGSP